MDINQGTDLCFYANAFKYIAYQNWAIVFRPHCVRVLSDRRRYMTLFLFNLKKMFRQQIITCTNVDQVAFLQIRLFFSHSMEIKRHRSSPHCNDIWASWRLTSSASLQFFKSSLRLTAKKPNVHSIIPWSIKFTGDRWIPVTKAS